MTTLLQALLVIGGSVALAVAAHLFVRRRISLDVRLAHNEVAGLLMSVVVGIYGILVAFIAVIVWQQHDRARETVAQEANETADLFRLADGFPEPVRSQLRSTAVKYVEVMEKVEWPLLASGASSPQSMALSRDLWHTLAAYKPDNSADANLHHVALLTMRSLSDARRERLELASRGIGPLLWTLLIVGAVIILGFTNFFGLRYDRSQALMIGALAGILGFVLFTISALDYPFRGDLRVPPDQFQRVHAMMVGEP